MLTWMRIAFLPPGSERHFYLQHQNVEVGEAGYSVCLKEVEGVSFITHTHRLVTCERWL